MRSEKQKMLAGEPYASSDPELVADRLACRRVLQRFNHGEPPDDARMASMLGELLGSAGENAWVEPPFHCDYGFNIHAGAGFYANFSCIILDVARVDLGAGVFFGPGVHVYTATHPLDPDERVSGFELARPVRIGARAWLGGGSIVLPGVTIGEGSTIGAGSVVTRDVPPYVLAAGNPCRVVRSLR
jgi:maltose O-acetyltransferase